MLLRLFGRFPPEKAFQHHGTREGVASSPEDSELARLRAKWGGSGGGGGGGDDGVHSGAGRAGEAVGGQYGERYGGDMQYIFDRAAAVGSLLSYDPMGRIKVEP